MHRGRECGRAGGPRLWKNGPMDRLQDWVESLEPDLVAATTVLFLLVLLGGAYLTAALTGPMRKASLAAVVVALLLPVAGMYAWRPGRPGRPR